MVGNYFDLSKKAASQELLSRLNVAVVDAAIGIYAEAATTPNHANRLALALAVVNSPESYAKRMIWTVVKLATDETDANLKNAVLVCWNGFAGMAA